MIKALTNGMGTTVEVIDDDLDDLPIVQHKWVGVHTVDSWVVRIFADGQGSGKAGYLLPYVSNVVERSSRNGISKTCYKQMSLFGTCSDFRLPKSSIPGL